MRVANRKCIRRLSIAHMKSARNRNIITILAIVLTTVLFTTLFTAGISLKEGFEQSNFRQAGGYNHAVFKNITKEQYFNEYGWTDEMWEMRQTMYDLLEEHPVFDFYKGVSLATFDNLDNPAKDAYHNGTSWTQTKETIFGSVQSEVDKANASIEG